MAEHLPEGVRKHGSTAAKMWNLAARQGLGGRDLAAAETWRTGAPGNHRDNCRFPSPSSGEQGGVLSCLLAALADPTPTLPEAGEGA